MFNGDAFLKAAESIGFGRKQLKLLLYSSIAEPSRFQAMALSKAKTYIFANLEEKRVMMEVLKLPPVSSEEVVCIEFKDLAAYILH